MINRPVASGLVSDSIAAAATFWLRLSECYLFTDYLSQPAACLQIIPFSGSMSGPRGVSAGGLLALYPESTHGGGICAAPQLFR